jgi:hypothetical protein
VNNPIFSDHFNDTLELMRHLKDSENYWHNYPYWHRDPGPILKKLTEVFSAYEAKHGHESMLGGQFIKRYISNASYRRQLVHFWNVIRGHFLYYTIKSMVYGRIRPFNDVESILRGVSLDFSPDSDDPNVLEVFKAISDVNGYDIESVKSSAAIACMMVDD